MTLIIAAVKSKRTRRLAILGANVLLLSFCLWNLPAFEKWRIRRDAENIRTWAEAEAFARRYGFKLNVLNLPTGEPALECYRPKLEWLLVGSKVIYVQWRFAQDRTVTSMQYEYEAHLPHWDRAMEFWWQLNGQ